MRWFVPILAGIMLSVMPASATAATWGVNDTADTPIGQACPGFADCSLREAVTSTEANPGPDVILVAGGLYPLANGQLDVTQDLTVEGDSAANVSISGSDSSRVFNVSAAGTDFLVRFLSLNHGRVSGAGPSHGGAILGGPGTTIGIESSLVTNSNVDSSSDAQGGGIYSQGSVSIGTASGSNSPSLILGNSAIDSSGTARGGGVAVSGAQLTVGARTVISGNIAVDDGAGTAAGGGVWADSGASFTQATVSDNTVAGRPGIGGGVAIGGGVGSFTRSTVNDNTATPGSGSTGGGGGIGLDSSGLGSVALSLSTVSGNTVDTPSASSVNRGGGILSLAGASSITATNSTISANTILVPGGGSASGAGIYSLGGSLTVGGTILAANSGSGGTQCDGGSLTSNGYSVLGSLGSCTYTPGTGDVTGVVDPQLKALAPYGGPTATMMLDNGSPALDIIPAAAALCSNQATDQRGISRPQNGDCDSGSVEARPATLDITPSTGRDFGDTPLSTPGSANLTISNGGDLDTPAPAIDVAAPFSASGCASTLDGGTNCILDVQFAPTAGGVFSDTLQATSGSASDSAPLSGVGWAPTRSPRVRGTTSVGYKMGVATGRWPGPVATFDLQWVRCDADGTSNCVDIAGATGLNYRPALADEDHTLRVRETATSSHAVTSDPVVTAASPVVTRTAPTLRKAPRIQQATSPTVDTRLNASHGQWTGAPDSYAFQWIRCDADGTSNCADIAGQTLNHYRTVPDDLGHTLRLRVVATNPAGSSTPATSAPSGVVS